MNKPARRRWWDEWQESCVPKVVTLDRPNFSHWLLNPLLDSSFKENTNVILTREEAEKMLSSLNRASAEFGTSAFHGGIYEAKEMLEAAMKA